MFLEGLSLLAAEPATLIWIVVGVGVGIIFGAVPGLTATMAIAIFLPITYGLSQVCGLATIIALYIGGVSGGLISAILLNMPGTPSSVATCFDGRPMALKGQADKAIGGGIIFSFLGTLFSIAALVFIAPKLAEIAVQFSPHEYFAVTFFSISLIITLSSDDLKKGFIAAILGMMLSCVGLDKVTGVPRYTFDMTAIRSGFSILTVLVGLYAIREAFDTAENVNALKDVKSDTVRMHGLGITFAEFAGQGWNALRSAVIGLIIGILPGIGGGTSNIIAYTVAKNQSRHPEKFGTGILDGVVASETANNATIGGAMIPLLTLGIPGDAATAMMLGGLAVHGLSPGPMIFQNYGPFLYCIFIVMVLCSIAMVLLEFLGLKAFIKVLKVPKNYLLPTIIVLCGVGAYGLNSRIFDVGATVFFGVIGMVLAKLKFPLPPLILGFILGSTMESSFRLGLIASRGDYMSFLTRPISGTLIGLTILFIAYSLFKIHRKRSPKAQNV